MITQKTQHERVLDYLKTHKEGMTSLDAFNLYGIMQMPKRIFILRNLGYKIMSMSETGKNRFGETVHYTRYVLKGEEDERNTR